jgi:hypothetical protein
MNENQRKAIQALERAALDGHQAGQNWRAYFAANVASITSLIRSDPAGWPTVRDRLLALLVSGDTGGMTPVGDTEADEVLGVVLAPHDTETQARLLPGAIP